MIPLLSDTSAALVVRVLTAMFLPLCLFWLFGSRLIAVLTAMKAGQPIREARKGVLAPEHQGKVGTPTMGGILLIGSALLATLLTADLANPLIQCCLLVTVTTAILGFLDDYAKITKQSTDGVSGWFKIAVQAAAAVACACYLFFGSPEGGMVIVPFYGKADIGWFAIPLAVLVMVGSSNAVNLTDGLDGLAGGIMIVVLATFLLFALPTSAVGMWPFIVALIAACVGFLWFNCYPAKVFMGDTGSLALGGALGTIAVCCRQELLLVVAGGVFVAEAVSVMIQVGWFKYTRLRYGEGRRFFRMAPLHHHFEKGGWRETTVCVRFWLISFVLCVVAVLCFAMTV